MYSIYSNLAYTPSLDLKSGIPQDTETPAPVRTRIREQDWIKPTWNRKWIKAQKNLVAGYFKDRLFQLSNQTLPHPPRCWQSQVFAAFQVLTKGWKEPRSTGAWTITGIIEFLQPSTVLSGRYQEEQNCPLAKQPLTVVWDPLLYPWL